MASSSMTLLSLPDDALSRLFSFLTSPPVYDENVLSAHLSNDPASPAAALAQTNRHLHTLYHLAVRVVDFTLPKCSCGTPPALSSYPSADAAVLDETRSSLRLAQPVTHLRTLCVRSFPSEDYVDSLLSSIPNVEDIVLNRSSSSSRTADRMAEATYDSKARKGMTSFLSRLPSGLRRLSVLDGFQLALLDGFWDRLWQLDDLEELNVNVNLKFFVPGQVEAMQHCARLQRLRVGCGPRLGDIGEFLLTLPPRLQHLFITLDKLSANSVTDQSSWRRDWAGPVSGLLTLRLKKVRVDNWAAFQAVAPHLRELELLGASVGSAGLTPPFPMLEVLHLDLVPGSLNDNSLVVLLSSVKALRKLTVTRGLDNSFQLTYKGLALALSICPSSSTLRELKLEFELNLKFVSDAPFERVAKAIGRQFRELKELDLKRTVFTPAGLEVIGFCCPHLTGLKLGDTKEVVPGISAGQVAHMATVIGSHFQRLVALDLSFSDIDVVGITYIGGGCSQLINLSLVHCSRIDNLAVAVIGQEFHLLAKLDIRKTSVTLSGLCSLDRKRQEGLELRVETEDANSLKSNDLNTLSPVLSQFAQ